MRPLILPVFALFLYVLSPTPLLGQQPKDMTVMLSASVAEQPIPRITLHWNTDANQQRVYIWRKLKEAAAFPGAAMDSVVAGSATQWTDVTVKRGIAYEYRLLRYSRTQTGYDSVNKVPIYKYFYATGYIVSGIAAPPSPRERMLVLADSTMLGPLQAGLALLKQDLENEGWEVTTLGTPRAESFNGAKVNVVRDLIKGEWLAGQKDLGGVILIGRVPVPYSGNIAPDGHPDHMGAWPADGIYGVIDGTYSDNFVNVKNAGRPANENLLADGKYDPGQWSTDIDIPIGRIDFFDMPVFAKSETELLQAYLQKNHDYRTNLWNVTMGGIIDDNFGTYGELFAASAWRSFSVFGSDTAVRAGDFFTDLAGPTTMLLGYGCGGGTDNSADGIGSSADLATKPVHAVFAMLFGSYFGDWNTQNNLLRSAIATQPRVLASGWSGRPHWYLHHMALGETIGYSTRISQNNRPIVGNNFGNYVPNITVGTTGLNVASAGDRSVHIALMGDPSLRAVTKPVAVIASVTAQTDYPNKVLLSWSKPAGDAQAYLVYRKLNGARKWTPLTADPIVITTFKDSLVNQGSVQYMVRCCALRSTASGTFYDMGKGRIASVTTTDVADERGNNNLDVPRMDVGPNPAFADVNITLSLATSSDVHLELVNITGTIVWTHHASMLSAGQHQIAVDVSSMPIGRYVLRCSAGDTTSAKLVTVAR